MKTSMWVLVAAIVLVIAGAAYWYSVSSKIASSASSTAIATSTTPQGDGTPVGENLILGTNVDANYGSYLSAYNGMSLYTYSPDMALMGKPDASACTGSCATTWSPYTVASASDINVSAATSGTVGTITRADGTLQVTYNSMPLYFYSGDKATGDVTGEGLGGVWYLAKP
jgi:predicted lipoprotein with Yx(FWY)xxD motif